MTHHIRMTWTEDTPAQYGWYCNCGVEQLAGYWTQDGANAGAHRHAALNEKDKDPDSEYEADLLNEAWDRADAAIADAAARGEL